LARVTGKTKCAKMYGWQEKIKIAGRLECLLVDKSQLFKERF
jgi:hypothetical protein